MLPTRQEKSMYTQLPLPAGFWHSEQEGTHGKDYQAQAWAQGVLVCATFKLSIHGQVFMCLSLHFVFIPATALCLFLHLLCVCSCNCFVFVPATSVCLFLQILCVCSCNFSHPRAITAMAISLMVWVLLDACLSASRLTGPVCWAMGQQISQSKRLTNKCVNVEKQNLWYLLQKYYQINGWTGAVNVRYRYMKNNVFLILNIIPVFTQIANTFTPVRTPAI